MTTDSNNVVDDHLKSIQKESITNNGICSRTKPNAYAWFDMNSWRRPLWVWRVNNSYNCHILASLSEVKEKHEQGMNCLDYYIFISAITQSKNTGQVRRAVNV